MPTLNSITLPNGVTYNFEAEYWGAVPIKFYDASQEEQEFNALEVQLTESEGVTTTLYSINAPDGSTLWSWNDTNDTVNTSKDVQIDGSLYPMAGTYFKNSTALPQQTAAASYNVLCIDAFSNGGRAKFCTGTSSATGNTIAVRHVNGYLYATYFNQSSGAESPASYTSYAAFFSSDGFLRKSSKGNFTDWLGFHWSGQTAVPSYVWGGNANNTWYVYPPSVISGLKYLGSTSSSTAKNFTIPATTTEIIITGAFTGDGILKLFTSSVPKNLLSTTAREVWLSGGKGEQSGVAGGAARCLCNVTLVNSTTVQVKGTASNNGATSTLSATTYYVYYR